MGEVVRIACQGAAWLSIDEMVEFQGELKSLSKKNYERFKKEILETGVGFPFRIWRHEGQCFIIGGHQAKRTLVQMRLEGYQIPLVPVSFIMAKDMQEAKRRVLQDIAQYGQIERQGLYEFIHESELDFKVVEDSFDLPNVDMESFKFEYFKDIDLLEIDENAPETKSEVVDRIVAREEDVNSVEKAKETYLNNNIKQIVLYYEGPEFEAVLNRANRILQKYKLEDFSALFLKLIENEEGEQDEDSGIDAEDDNDQGLE